MEGSLEEQPDQNKDESYLWCLSLDSRRQGRVGSKSCCAWLDLILIWDIKKEQLWQQGGLLFQLSLQSVLILKIETQAPGCIGNDRCKSPRTVSVQNLRPPLLKLKLKRLISILLFLLLLTATQLRNSWVMWLFEELRAYTYNQRVSQSK